MMSEVPDDVALFPWGPKEPPRFAPIEAGGQLPPHPMKAWSPTIWAQTPL